MIILSAGMPRAGSGWHYNLIHDLVKASGGQDAHLIRRRFLLQPILSEVNCNIGALSVKRLVLVLLPSLLGNTFAIKVHAAPSPFALNLIRKGQMRATYIYRDPRAALLSAYENGLRAREKGQTNGFSHLTSIEKAIEFLQFYIRVWESWVVREDVLLVRYEDMLAKYEVEITRLLTFLQIPQSSAAVQAVVTSYRPENTQQDHKGMHFFKGQAERFRTALSPEQLAACNQAFESSLEKMGYTI